MFGFQGPLKQPEERSQAEAIHVVDLGQVSDDKVQGAPALGQGDITVALRVERGLKTHAFGQGLADGYAGCLGFVEGVQQFLVLQDVARGVGKLLQPKENVSVVWIKLETFCVVFVPCCQQ